MKTKVAIRILIGLLLISSAAGCIPVAQTTVQPVITEPVQAQEITFTSLAQGDSYTAELEAAAVYIAGSLPEMKAFTGWFNDPQVIGALQQVDFDANLVIAVFSGQFGSSGHGVSIQAINFTEEGVQIIVELTTPASDQAVADVISYPFQVVQVSRDSLPVAPGTIWKMLSVDGKILSESIYP